MVHGVGAPPGTPTSGSALEKVLPVISLVTMVMTLPQIWTVWVERNVAGISLLTWGTYLAGACLWLVHGVQKRDKTIYIACIGWVLLDGAVVAGALLFG